MPLLNHHKAPLRPTFERPEAALATTPGLSLYLLFVISWFLHLPARVQFLGTIRFDLALVCLLAGIAIVRRQSPAPPSAADRALRILIAYAILSIPFVYWPGSAIKFGLKNFIEGVVFFYFTIAFVRTERDLKRFMLVFLVCQVFRILEPLYLNVTQGYWGDRAHLGNFEFMQRLSGAPSDVINPNGLAFVICTVLPFLYYMGGLSFRLALVTLALAPPCLYALALTGSRSGVIGLAVIALGIILKAKSRMSFVLAGLGAAIVLGFGFTLLDPITQDRYLSIVGAGEKNVATAEERWEGIEAQFDVILKRPVFGYGLGTSAEANANFTTSGPYAGRAMLAHNLYAEVALELGLIGLAIFLYFVKTIFSGFVQARKAVNKHRSGYGFTPRLVDAMEVWFAMNLVYSFASYGLSSYEWYLFGGLSVVLLRLTQLRQDGVRGHATSNAVLGTKGMPARAGSAGRPL